MTYTREQLVAMARAESAKNGFPEDVFEAQINLESNFDPAAVSPAGAKGIAQLMSVHFEGRFDPFDPAVALAYAAKWMGDLYRQFGRIDLALAAYNAGPGAVATYGNQIPPFQETRTYVRTILNAVLPDVLKGPSVAMAQFDPVLGGPSSALASLGYDKDTILSACGPIALEAMATVLNPSHPPTISDVLDAAPRFGWTRAGGMNGAANLVALAREFGVGLDEVRPAEVEGKLLAGQPVIVSTGIHFYFAQRHSRSDDDLFVGNTGLARKGGAEWMSLDRIAANDASYGGINGLFVGRLISEGSNVNDTTTAPAAEPVADGRVEALEKAADAFRGGEHAEQCLAIAVEHALYLYKDLAALKAAGKEAA